MARGTRSSRPRQRWHRWPQPCRAVQSTGWDLLIKDDKTKALTDWTAWLIEHGFPFKILDDGQVIAGPFATKEIAEQKKAQLADKQNMESQVVEHKAQP